MTSHRFPLLFNLRSCSIKIRTYSVEFLEIKLTLMQLTHSSSCSTLQFAEW